LWSSDVLALGAALLWMVHPLQSEAVNYISARSDSLAGLFFFLTLYCAMRGRDAVAGRLWWEGAAIAACAIGATAGPFAMTAPIVVLLHDRTLGRSFAEGLAARRWLYLGLAATWVELGGLMWLSGWPPVGRMSAVSPWTSFLNQVQMVGHYLWLTVWPRALVLDYGPPQTLSLAQVWPAAVLLVALVAAALTALRRWPRIGMLGIIFFLTLAPSAILAPALDEVGAERRMYVPLAALSILAVVTGSAATGRLAARFPARSKAMASLAIDVVFVMLLACAVRTVYRSEQYAEPVALWTGTVTERPHGRARYALGTALIAAGAEDDGIAELRLAAPDVPAAKYALGNELYVIGQMEEAARVLQEFIDAQPVAAGVVPARLLRARALMARGFLEEAAAEFEAALRASPASGDARDGLAELAAIQRIVAADFVKNGRVADAVLHAREAVRLGPDDAAAHATLGTALAAAGSTDEAIVQFREALRIDPAEAEAQSGLAAALKRRR
jgi:tetratricopeptide (TPR) repeat protein